MKSLKAPKYKHKTDIITFEPSSSLIGASPTKPYLAKRGVVPSQKSQPPQTCPPINGRKAKAICGSGRLRGKFATTFDRAECNHG